MTLINQYYIRESATFGRKIKEEFVVINTRTESFFVLNDTGETIYRTLGRKKTLTEIMSKIAANFATDAKTLEKDILFFLEDGVKKGLFKSVSSNNRRK